ncbi:glycosyl-phosphatidylinositol-anchored molecule-like protein [Arvicanthis niloticus]|uniref:glycosyl-phosphatidylinositol-anchored molecule-like protein n=1 Tax=Arvicanthis niloticus TaxID=61156 RepID=UPI001487048E|nr:glycosyl-phosphatidylinositol-anchored molecule-like protein [Arvicanthis niloticus]
MMPSFFLLILLGLPWVDTTVNNSSGMDNSTSGLGDDKEPRRMWETEMQCKRCSVGNQFTCDNILTCPSHVKRCLTIAVRVNLRLLYVYKDCAEDCSFIYKEEIPPVNARLLKNVKNFYFVLCCTGSLCNEGGPYNIERDLLPDRAIEEEEIARAMSLGRFNLLLCPALVLSSSILI